jgi:hypothetical protein
MHRKLGPGLRRGDSKNLNCVGVIINEYVG